MEQETIQLTPEDYAEAMRKHDDIELMLMLVDLLGMSQETPKLPPS